MNKEAPMNARRRRLVAMTLAAVAPLAALAQDAPVRLRVTIESPSDTRMVLRERSGERVDLGAMAVTLFPQAMRGTGEGHRPFDFMPQSTMTNATVDAVSVTAQQVAGGPTALRISAGRNGFAPPC
jgi:hypothetical protein